MLNLKPTKSITFYYITLNSALKFMETFILKNGHKTSLQC